MQFKTYISGSGIQEIPEPNAVLHADQQQPCKESDMYKQNIRKSLLKLICLN